MEQKEPEVEMKELVEMKEFVEMKEHWKESKQKKWLKTATAEKRNHHFRPQLKTTTRTMRKRILMKRDKNDMSEQVKQE